MEQLEVEVILELQEMVYLVAEVVVSDQDNLLHQVDVEMLQILLPIKEMMVEMERVKLDLMVVLVAAVVKVLLVKMLLALVLVTVAVVKQVVFLVHP